MTTRYEVKYFYKPSNEWLVFKRTPNINEAYKTAESQRTEHTTKCLPHDCWYPKWEVEEVDGQRTRRYRVSN